MQIIHIPAFSDNYIWLIMGAEQQTCVVDPGSASEVIERLEQLGTTLSNILITHHHHDHVGGVKALLEAYPKCQVYAPQHSNFDFPYIQVGSGEDIQIDGLGSFKVLGVAGHTLEHVAYYSEPHLFIGDTLFSAGCGRIFEGTPEQMFAAMQLIKTLPVQTNIYPAHEYTQNNLIFALAADVNNQDLKSYQQWVSKTRQQGLPTVPTTLETELKINPFLRSDIANVVAYSSAHSQQALQPGFETFKALRAWKDNF